MHDKTLAVPFDADARTLLTGAALLAGALLIYSLLPRNRFAKPLPPSPKGLPLIGHTHLMSGVRYSWRTFHEYAVKMKAPVMYFKLGTSDVVVISSCKAASDLLEKKSALYSDRPRMIVPGEYISNNRRMVLLHYGEKWRNMRRFLHAHLHDKMAATYEPVQDQESKALMLSLLEDPNGFSDHIQLFSSNIILQVAYNRRAGTVQDECIQEMIHSIETWAVSALPGAHFVADFPILDYAPAFMAPWKSRAKKLHLFEVKLYEKLTAGVRRKMANGELPECLMRHLLQRQEEFGLDDEDVLYLAGTLFEAGSDTTTSLLTSLVLACTADPSIATKAQEEVDRVVGDKRLPTFADMDDLPYVIAVGKELQRWRPAVPSAVPHALTEDDEYMGYHLPKGATIICNTWAIGRDPDVFPDGETFRPERYLGKEGAKLDAALNKGHTGFGHARRICPGLHVAERSMFIALAMIFWSFNLGPKEGEPLPDVFNYTEGFVSRPYPFNAEIKVRSEAKARMIRQEGKEALREMESLYE